MGQWEMDLSWHADAACRDLNVEDFYTDSDDNSGERKRYEYHKRNELRKVCAKCPVVEQCLNHALKYEHHGFWAGTTNKDRRELRKKLGIICMDPPSMHESQAIAARAKIAKQRGIQRERQQG